MNSPEDPALYCQQQLFLEHMLLQSMAVRDIEAEDRADADAKRVSEAEANFAKALGAAPTS